MKDRGKKYQEAVKKVDLDRRYSPDEAIVLAKETSYVKFDATVEVHIRTSLDPRHADQQVRGIALLPNGLGKAIRVAVFTQGEGLRIATEAGADTVGADDLIKQVQEGWLEFDVGIATQDFMPKIAPLGRILGRRGLMPNPRSGTVVPVQDLGRAISDARKGRVEFRLDRTAIIHVPIGKVSFENDKLLGNLSTLIEAIVTAKPSGAKGQYIRSVALATSMGPGIQLDLTPTLALRAA